MLWGAPRIHGELLKLGFAVAQSTVAWLHDRQDSWLLAFEDTAHISAGLVIRIRKARPVAHQAPDLGKVTRGIDRGYCVARCQGDDLRTPTDKKRVGSDQQCAAGLLREVCEGRIDLATGTGAKDFDRKSKRRSIRLQVFDLDLGIRTIGVDERDKAVGSRRYLTQHPEPLCHKLHKLKVYAGGVAARQVEAGDKT